MKKQTHTLQCGLSVSKRDGCFLVTSISTVLRHRAECQRYLENIQNRCWWPYNAIFKKQQQQTVKKKLKVVLGNTFALVCLLVVALWPTRTFCCTRCVLCCSLQGLRQAVLLCLRRYCRYRSLVCAFTSWCAQKKHNTNTQKYEG